MSRVSPKLVLDQSDPCMTAQLFVRLCPGLSAATYEAGVFYGPWPSCSQWSERTVRDALWPFLNDANKRGPNGRLVRFSPRKADVDEILEIVCAICSLPSAWGIAA